MANLFAVVDPDPARRAACLGKAAAILDVVSGLVRGQCASATFGATWSASPRTPVSIVTDDAGAAVLWGDALEPDGARRDATAVRASWVKVAEHIPAPADGFHAAVIFDAQRGLVAGADLFGLFPMYYWASGDVVLASTSMGAFRAHPLFKRDLDLVALTGILLTGGLIDGDTVCRGVRRLSAGHLLTWSPDRGTKEVRQYSMPVEETLAHRSFDDQVTLLDQALDGAVTRHLGANGDIGLSLSGGRDSRLVAGMLHRHGRRPRTLTLGEPRDYEVVCAAAVAETLSFPHAVASDPLADVEAMARLHLRQEELSNGLANFYTWGMAPRLAPLGERVWSGYWFELFVGGTSRALPSAPNQTTDPFERVFLHAASYGIGPARLRTLARRDVFDGSMDECVERLRAQYAALPGDPDRKAWQFDFLHRARYHAGSTPWRMSLGAWPVLLSHDQSLVQLCASLPMSTLLCRRAEDELLRTRFPALARLPLDRNSHVLDPLLGPAAPRPRLAERARRLFRGPSGERRRYYRLYDINSPIWREVRRLAEAGRRRATEVLDAAELNAFLPPPDARIDLREPINDSNGLKALLGFLIWWPDHG